MSTNDRHSLDRMHYCRRALHTFWEPWAIIIIKNKTKFLMLKILRVLFKRIRAFNGYLGLKKG